MNTQPVKQVQIHFTNQAAFVADGTAYCETSRIIEKLTKDIVRMSPEGQTYICEVWHALLLFFAPKHIHYSYHGQLAR